MTQANPQDEHVHVSLENILASKTVRVTGTTYNQLVAKGQEDKCERDVK